MIKKNRDVIQKTLAYLLIAVGLLQITGVLINNEIIEKIAKSTAASPKPTPLTGTSDYEHFTVNGTITLILSSKNYTINPRDVFMEMKGPHKRKIVFLSALNKYPVHENYDTVLQYVYCDQHLLKEKVSSPVTSLAVHIESKKNNQKWEYKIPC